MGVVCDAIASMLLFMNQVWQKLCLVFGKAGNMNPMTLLAVLVRYRRTDFVSFMKSHRAALERGHQTGDYVSGVCNYYRLMSDLITFACGPYWHFTPMTEGYSRMQCHDLFHHTMTRYLGARDSDDILEIGCGYGEIGRQVAKISGASVVGLTMADEEIVGANERIKRAGLDAQCRMVQGDYHELPFEAASFDKVFGVYTLKYSAHVSKAISEAARVLKPGGRFVSYEILVSDKYDPLNKEDRKLVDNISHSTCMPALWSAGAFRDAAEKAGLVLKVEEDLCSKPKEGQWYTCFEQTCVHHLLMSPLVGRLVRLGESLRILPKSFSDFYESCLVHPTTDFVLAGRKGIITGAVMMVWEKA